MRFIRHTNGQIRALETFTLYDGRVITAGTLGGTIDSIRNLSQAGTSWVFPGGSIEGNKCDTKFDVLRAVMHAVNLPSAEQATKFITLSQKVVTPRKEFKDATTS